MDENLKRKAQKLLNNNGDEFLTQLEATLELSDKLDSLTEAVKAIPETVIPEYPEPIEEVVIANLPEVQKVEITNLPTEKDDKEQLALLKEISQELKKKEQYAYDIEIDPALKEQLKGERGEDGLSIKGDKGDKGDDGSPDTPQEIVGKLSTLSGEERLDARYIKNLPEPRASVGGSRLFSQLLDTEIINPTDGQVPVYDLASQKWKNVTFSGGGTPASSVVDETSYGQSSDVGTSTDFARADHSHGTPVLPTKTDIGLGNVDNTSDLNKPVSTATQTALNGKQTTLVSGTNIKTINGVSVLGSGDMTISGGTPDDSFGVVVDGGGSAITTGSKGVKYIPWDCTITGWDIRSDVSGSCVFDIKRSGSSIAGTEKPTLSSASSNSDLALSTWTTSLSAGDVIEFVVDSTSTITRATVTILISKL